MKKPQLLRYEEWQSGSGRWYCNDTSDLTSDRSLWWTPARMLEVPPVRFVQMLIEEFEVDYISFDKILVYSWKDQAKMRKFKNFINREARRRNFII